MVNFANPRSTASRQTSQARKLILGIALALASASIWTACVLYGNNTFFLKNRWIVAKALSPRQNGGFEFLLTRLAVAQNELHLDAWANNQMVFLKESKPPARVLFDFYVGTNAYLDVTFNRVGGGYEAVRISRNLDTFAYRAREDGKFEWKAPVFAHVGAGWHRGLLDQVQGRLRLRVDGKELARFDLRFSRGNVGFRGFNDARIRKVAIAYADSTSMAETFSNHVRLKTLFAMNLVLIAFLTLLISRFGKGVQGGMNGWARLITLVGAQLLILGLMWFSFDYFYWSKLPLCWTTSHFDYEDARLNRLQGIERARQLFFSSWYALSGAPGPDLRDPYGSCHYRGYPRRVRGVSFCAGVSCSNNLDDLTFYGMASKYAGVGRHLLIFGGSQMTRLGLLATQPSYLEFLQRRLQKMPGSLEWVTGNLSTAPTPPLDEFFRDYYSKIYDAFRPDIVILNHRQLELEHLHALRKELKEFFEFNRAHHVKTLIVQRSIEYATIPISAELRTLAARYHVMIADSQTRFHSPEIQGSGNLWFDNFHFTQYAQEIYAGWLASELSEAGGADVRKLSSKGGS